MKEILESNYNNKNIEHEKKVYAKSESFFLFVRRSDEKSGLLISGVFHFSAFL
jgi:hypothetical protein